jgi:hypothetical protein
MTEVGSKASDTSRCLYYLQRFSNVNSKDEGVFPFHRDVNACSHLESLGQENLNSMYSLEAS